MSVTYDRRKAAGICQRCGEVPVQDGRFTCAACLKVERARIRAKREGVETGAAKARAARLKAAERCPRCDLLLDACDENGRLVPAFLQLRFRHECVAGVDAFMRSGEEGGSDGGGSFRSLWGGRSR